MTTLLASSTATNVAATEGDVKTFLDNIRTYMADLLGTDSANKSAVLTLLGAALNSTVIKTATHTVVAADRGKVFACNGTFTQNIQAAATLGDGFVFAVWNTGSGTITIDPNLTETINGASTSTLLAGKMALIYCNGSAFVSVAGFALADLLALDGAGSGLDADLLDGQEGSYYATSAGLATKVPVDVGSGNVGCFRLCSLNAGSLANNATTSGANINPSGSGTWRNVSGFSLSSSDPTVAMFQRIA